MPPFPSSRCARSGCGYGEVLQCFSSTERTPNPDENSLRGSSLARGMHHRRREPPGATTRFAEAAPFASLDARSLAHYRAQARLPDLAPSWIAPGAALSTALLYVSDWDSNDVFIYDYSTRKAAGKLSGLRDPYGQCVDRSGNVWIAEAGGFTVVAYPYASKTPLKRLQTTGYPIGCAVNGGTATWRCRTSPERQEPATCRLERSRRPSDDLQVDHALLLVAAGLR